MARRDPTLIVRLPATLKECIKRSAAQNRRTITGEVVFQLEQLFSKENEKAETVAAVSAD